MSNIEKAIQEASQAAADVINRREFSATDALEIAEGVIAEMEMTIMGLRDDIAREAKGRDE